MMMGRGAGRLRGVIFDMDGVLVESEPYTADAAIQLFAERGFTVHREEFRPFVGQGEERFMGGVAEVRGIPFEAEVDVPRLYAIYLDLIRGRLGPAPGAREFVLRCRDRGLVVAVASSAETIKVKGNLAEVGLPEATFSAVVTGSEVPRKKPAPDLFLEAARRLDLEPDRCLVVEDAVAGVASARAAGCRCLALTTTFRADQLVGADWVARNLASVPEAALDW